MNDAQRNLLTAGLICAASASLVGGVYFRARTDRELMGSRTTDLLAPGLSASREPKVEVSEEKQFIELTTLLKQHYVDPIEDEDKLAIGAVKGMIASLDDEQSLFMSEPVFRSFVRSLQGEYDGIGATLALVRTGAPPKKTTLRTTLDFLARVPRVQVTYVVPGGPAERAGLKPGDEIDSIDERWVVNPTVGDRYRKVDAAVRSGAAPASARAEMQNELRQKFGNSMMPLRALERLSVGVEGHVQLSWRRGDQVSKGELAKAKTSVPVNKSDQDGPVRLSFVIGAPEAIEEALKSGRQLALDLRGVGQGDLKIMLACLSKLAPSGDYGEIVRSHGEPQVVRVVDGAKETKPIRVLVDRFTRGVAEAFVLALKSKGLAQIEGGPMAGTPSIIERTALPDGSGFTLRVGEFQANRRSA